MRDDQHEDGSRQMVYRRPVEILNGGPLAAVLNGGTVASDVLARRHRQWFYEQLERQHGQGFRPTV